MVKRIGRRFVSLLLTFVTILTLLPAMTLPALAAPPTMPAGLTPLTFTDLSTTGFPYAEDIKTGITINDDNNFTGGATISGKIITITAKGTNNTGCDNPNATVTLTLTNSHATTATLTFTKDEHVKVVKGVGESSVSGSDATIPYGGSIEVSVTSKGGTQVSGTFTVTGLEFEVNTLTTTFLSGENGSYTIRTDAGEELTTGVEYTKPSTVRYHLEPKPNAGYAFDRWIDFDTKETLSTSSAYETSGGGRIAPVFAPIGCARYYIAGASKKIEYSYLDEAIAAAGASGTIVAASDGTVFGSKGQKTFTIPSGVTLLIPFNEGGTLYTDEPEYMKDYVTPSVFRKLTMASGSSIIVKGAISVGGKHCYAMQKQGPSGPYGQIDMAAGSTIVLNSGANLYAWGYITGDGQITATSGSTVYEYFQMMDFRGGNATLAMRKNEQKVFPISQYYVQNIEAALTLQAGAREITRVTINAAKVTTSPSINFIGDKNSLFRIYDEGTLTKKYDPETDRITYTTTGKASLDSLALKVAIYDIDSKNFVLPVNNNMTLEILSGSVEVNSDAALLPGAQITIARGAELNVTSGTSLYVYDLAQWKKEYAYSSDERGFVPVPYSPTKTGTRTLSDAKIDVNGTLTAAGSVYTTQSGANICSSEGGGRFVQQGTPGTATVTYQATQKGNEITGYPQIPITPAQLQNAAGVNPSYTQTKDARAGDTFTYCKCQECGGGTWVPNLMVAEFNATQYGTLQDAANAAKGKPYVSLLHSTTEDIIAQNDIYLDLHGYTVTGYFDMDGHILYGMDSTTDGYDDRTAGKIVGGASFYKNIYQTGNMGDDTYKRYVAIQGKEADKETANLSFHRFNISVTGYRFELATGDTPQCALFFIGKFQGDKAAKDYLKSLGFTLKGENDAAPKEGSCEMPKALTDKFVEEDGDAYLFEFYLKRSFEKNPPDDTAYTEKFFATAQATFKNDETQKSETKDWSFQEAWQNSDMAENDKTILNNFFKEFGINIQVE